MKKEDLKSTEELLQKRFSGVKRDIRDPGQINAVYKEKKKNKQSVFSRPGMQLAGVFLAAAIVGAGTFGALKFIEYRGSRIAGQSGTDPANTSAVTGTDVTKPADTGFIPEDDYDRLILFIDPDTGDSFNYTIKDFSHSIGDGGNNSMERLGIKVEKNVKSSYTSYTLTTRNGEGTTEYPGFMQFSDKRTGYDKNVIILKDGKKSEITALYVTEDPEPAVRTITDDLNGNFTTDTVDVSAVTELLGERPYYMYLDFEKSSKTTYSDTSLFSKILLKVMYCTEAITQFSYYDCEKAFAVNIVDGKFVLGEEYETPDVPDLSDVEFTVRSGDSSCRAVIISSYNEDITKQRPYLTLEHGDPYDADVKSLEYGGGLELLYDEEKMNELFVSFNADHVSLYNDYWELLGTYGLEGAVRTLDKKEISSAYVVFHCVGRDDNKLPASNMFCYDLAVYVNLPEGDAGETTADTTAAAHETTAPQETKEVPEELKNSPCLIGFTSDGFDIDFKYRAFTGAGEIYEKHEGYIEMMYSDDMYFAPADGVKAYGHVVYDVRGEYTAEKTFDNCDELNGILHGMESGVRSAVLFITAENGIYSEGYELLMTYNVSAE